MGLQTSPQCCCVCPEQNLELPPCLLGLVTLTQRLFLVELTAGSPTAIEEGLYEYCGASAVSSSTCVLLWISPDGTDVIDVEFNTGSSPVQVTVRVVSGANGCNFFGGASVAIPFAAFMDSPEAEDFFCNEVAEAFNVGGLGDYELTMVAP